MTTVGDQRDAFISTMLRHLGEVWSRRSWPELYEDFRENPELLAEGVRRAAGRIVDWIEDDPSAGVPLVRVEGSDERVEAVPVFRHAVRLLDCAPVVVHPESPDAHTSALLGLLNDLSRSELTGLLLENPDLYRGPGAAAAIDASGGFAMMDPDDEAGAHHAISKELHRRYLRDHRRTDLDRAIECGERALAGVFDRTSAQWLQVADGLGTALKDRFRLIGDPADLARSRTVLAEAVEVAAARGSTELPRYQHHLGLALKSSYELSPTLAFLTASADLHRRSVAATRRFDRSWPVRVMSSSWR
ncbi:MULTISPECIES: hypothetical protein [Saccharothrix]|uniref:hypothetical protein n=1 Tax=Saccharothrix TaxID=2071 RepID=UPI00093E7121|nr:hypothetical protein [Saccharothrix sp. CB00851]OKI26381.1 hypothetical protein A6A25_32365 [Saccharothrix sp. CB00851]